MSSKVEKGSNFSMNAGAINAKQRLTILQGYKILLNGFLPEETEKFAGLALYLGANISISFQKDISCCIIKRVGSSICSDAYKNEIAVVTVDWLLECQSKKLWLPFDSYLAPPFYGLVVCVSQLSAEERVESRKYIIEGGGKFSADLVKGTTTHLIINRAEGEKFIHASNWETVHIVKPSWIHACLEERRWIEEKPFSVKLKEFSSSSNLSAVNLNGPQNGIDFSGEKGEALVISIPNTPRPRSLIYEAEKYLCQKIDSSRFPLPRSISSEKRSIFRHQLFLIEGYRSSVKDYMSSCIIYGGGRVSQLIVPELNYAALGEECADSIKSKLVLQSSIYPLEIVNLAWLIDILFGSKVLTSLVPFLLDYE